MTDAIDAVRGADSLLTLLDDGDDDFVEWRHLGRRYVVIRNPDDVEHVLFSGSDRYVKAAHYRLLAAVTGNGRLTSEGDTWAHQRRVIQPLFSRRNLDVLGAHMVNATDEHLQRWSADDAGRVVDIAEDMTRLTLDVIARALFGAQVPTAAERLRPAVDVGLRTAVIAAQLQMFLSLPRRLIDTMSWLLARAPVLPAPLRGVQHAMRTIDAVVAEALELRLLTGDERAGDMVGLLVAARYEENRASEGQIRDELKTFLLAGHETTANGLAWMWHLLGANPETRQRLYDEVDELDDVTADVVADLPWTAACFREALRLYPPAWILEREAVADDVLDGRVIRRGTTVMIPVYAIHRGRRWDDPLSFKPERFLGLAPKRGTYLPFGAGRRVCIGATFAALEAAIITASIARRFQLDPIPGFVVEPEATVTLRPRGGLPMRLTAR
ncbi:MAG: cytochrome P450 [Acidimicrobiales bacterium]